MKTLKVLGTACLMGAALIATTAVFAERDKGRGTGPVILVTSQGLYYDSIVLADPLPMKGDFQQLVMGMNGLETEFGPGEVGHLGGRWWLDLNGNGVMDEAGEEGDKYFLCPLLGPGRETM